MVYRFDQFEVDDREFRLSEDGAPVQVEPKVLRLLVYLIENRNRLVRKQELLDKVWPDAMVTENALTRTIVLLRKALNENSQVPRYLETIPTAGYRFIADVRVAGEAEADRDAGLVAAGAEAGVPAAVAVKRFSRERIWQVAAGVAVVLLISAGVWITMHLRGEPAPPAMVQFEIAAPDKLNFYFSQPPAVSPDGQRIAFAASPTPFNNTFRLFVRSLNAANAMEIPTPGYYPGFPFWSPDGQQIAFTSDGNLQKVDLSGGAPVTICSDCDAVGGGTWNRDGVILITNRTTRSLMRVSASRGEAKPLHPLAPGEAAQMWPEFLPDGKHYLYLSLGKAPYQQGIYAGTLDSNDRTFLVASNTNAAYVQSGQVLFTRGSTLMAQPFDIGSLKLSGESRPVADHIESGATRSSLPIATFAASPNGVVVWRLDNRTSPSQLQWFDRNGKALGVVGEVADYSNPCSFTGRQQTGRQHPRPADEDAGHLDLRPGAWRKDPADLRSRRRPGLCLVAGWNPDRLHLRPLWAEEYLLEAG